MTVLHRESRPIGAEFLSRSRLDHFGVAKAGLGLAFICLLIVRACAQSAASTPRFEDYPVHESFKGPPAVPRLVTPQERRFRTVIDRGLAKGYGVVHKPSGKEEPRPNFAAHYFIVTWGCGAPCLMAAIVDARSGRVLPPPFHHGPGDSYFQVPWAFPMEPPLDYRLDSRLLIARICEKDKAISMGGRIVYQAEECGAHYFLISDGGLTLLSRSLEK